jgi:hypothetical protein
MVELKDMVSLGALFVFIAIVLSIGATVTDDVADQVVSYTATAASDTWHPANTSDAKNVSENQASDNLLWDNYAVFNASSGFQLTSANYSTTPGGTITLLDVGTQIYDDTNLNVTFNYYTTTSVAYDAASNGSDSLGEMASWLPTIALVLAAAVVLGTVFMWFNFRRR